MRGAQNTYVIADGVTCCVGSIQEISNWPIAGPTNHGEESYAINVSQFYQSISAGDRGDWCFYSALRGSDDQFLPSSYAINGAAAGYEC